MSTAARTPAKPGLRELKKERTRQTILKVALELFAERGYANTTLGDIAAAAEVSSGTLFAYFPSKENILFPEERHFCEQLRQRLEQRASDETTFDVLRDFLPTLEPPDETFAVRLKIMNEAGLRGRHRSRYSRVDQLLAEAIANDVGSDPDDLRVQLLAAAAGAAMVTVGERLQPGTDNPVDYDEALALLKQMLDILSSAMAELRPRGPAR